MSEKRASYYGAMVMTGTDQSRLERCATLIAETLDDYGHPVERTCVLDPIQARITASHYVVTLTLTRPRLRSPQFERVSRVDRSAGLRPGARIDRETRSHMRLEIFPADPNRDDPEISELLLVIMLYRLVGACPVTKVEWLSPRTVLSRETFLEAFTHITPMVASAQRVVTRPPAPVRKRALLPDLEPAPEVIAFPGHAEDDEDEPDNDIRRLASWSMTGVTAFLCTPVAISLAGVNLIKGEDFRLNTHVLALTGFLVTLHKSDVLTSLVQRFGA